MSSQEKSKEEQLYPVTELDHFSSDFLINGRENGVPYEFHVFACELVHKNLASTKKAEKNQGEKSPCFSKLKKLLYNHHDFLPE